jgi:uncharacterized protein (UPF0128 family)
MNLNLKVKQGKRPAARHKVSAIRNINKPHEFGDFCFDYLNLVRIFTNKYLLSLFSWGL